MVLGVGVEVRLVSPVEASGVSMPPAVRVDVEDEGLVGECPNRSEEFESRKSDIEKACIK